MKTLIIFLTLLTSISAVAYDDADTLSEYNYYWDTAFFTNKKSIFTAKDNCFLWVRVNPGVGDLTIIAKQDASKVETFTHGYSRDFFTILDRHKLERIVQNNSDCHDGQCEFTINGKSIMKFSEDVSEHQEFKLRVTLKNQKLGIFALYLTDNNAREYINCYK